jgi:hypothetical protein
MAPMTGPQQYHNEFGTRAWGVDVTTGGDPVIVGAFTSPGPNAAMVVRFDGADGTEVWNKVLFSVDQVDMHKCFRWRHCDRQPKQHICVCEQLLN